MILKAIILVAAASIRAPAAASNAAIYLSGCANALGTVFDIAGQAFASDRFSNATPAISSADLEARREAWHQRAEA